MNGFDLARTVEQRSMKILRPFIQQRAFNGQFVVTSKGPLARELQRTVGDVLYNSDTDTVYSLEIKAEQSNKHGNFFLETWSNRAKFTTGWMFNCNADVLAYHFIEEDELYKIPLLKLKQWAFHEGKIYQYKEKLQEKYEQLNDTWGRCVRISDLIRDLKLKPPFKPAEELAAYDADADFGGSLEEGYRAIRTRMANGGPAWEPKQ